LRAQYILRIARQFKMQSSAISNISDWRKPYAERNQLEDLLHSIPAPAPYTVWLRWFEQGTAIIKETNSPNEPNQMALATATRDGCPSVRYVLLKGHDERGFYFYTNYSSRKGKELAENPRASLCQYWPELNRSIRIEGRVERTSAENSEAYFRSRPLPSQIGAAVSPQSQVVPSRDFLEDRRRELDARVSQGESVARPESWGGYCVLPTSYEFWQGQRDRLHDRVRFRRRQDLTDEEMRMAQPAEGDWVCERLAP
ncbi:hypothetical protein BOX15_Mlig003672g1, partial [Macrostomum lignano]